MLQTVSVTCVPTDGGGLWWRPWIRRRSEGHRGEDRSMSCESKITHLYHLLTLHSFRVWSSLGVSREAAAHHGCFISHESVMTLNYTPLCYSLSVCDVHDLLFISPWCVCLVRSLVVCRCSLEIIGRAPVSPLWSLVSLASTGHKCHQQTLQRHDQRTKFCSDLKEADGAAVSPAPHWQQWPIRGRLCVIMQTNIITP